ncbi:response regulator [Caldalkalibacillus mannanilyticus]|uniref:response regulator n=1 Tax=Caldalkalibacillus mannanilyticus TaxID=1418 RepID=UPI000469CF1B|nr:response regulator [Caldalkalibacillus mannanilyticus]
MIDVLIIEDDSRIAEINRRFVEKVPGFQVLGIALDEQEAKEHLELLRPHLVLLDVYFPDTNGLELLRYIRQEYSDIDVIMITAAKEVRTLKEALHGGVFDFIVKPVVFDRFKETLLQYQLVHERLQSLEKEQVNQSDVDEILRGSVKGESGPIRSNHLPKGIDRLTLEKVYVVLHDSQEGLSAEAIGQEIGASRSTARRYLEYLVSTGEVFADLSYGVVGRPERVYHIHKKGSRDDLT